jgi:two-component system, NarL family, response regulator NreC
MKIKVLIADDNQLFRELLTDRFNETTNIEVVAEAEDGPEILQKVKLFEPDIVLMDIGMSRLKGLETTRILKRDFPDVKAMALTARDERNYIKGMLEVGGWGYLLKNCTFDQLVESITKVHSGKKCLSTDVEGIIIEDYLGHNLRGTTVLTEREIDILRLLAEGKSIREISEANFISIKTVGTHKQNIFDKLGFQNLAQLIRYALNNGFVS